mmetsp:Transcript_24561/g.68680  ORF Transcript_24561/g.68680 Transcript_24561/m.68680 type:complete len:233 (-) Transcript_24561:8-706(-)
MGSVPPARAPFAQVVAVFRHVVLRHVVDTSNADGARCGDVVELLVTLCPLPNSEPPIRRPRLPARPGLEVTRAGGLRECLLRLLQCPIVDDRHVVGGALRRVEQRPVRLPWVGFVRPKWRVPRAHWPDFVALAVVPDELLLLLLLARCSSLARMPDKLEEASELIHKSVHLVIYTDIVSVQAHVQLGSHRQERQNEHAQHLHRVVSVNGRCPSRRHRPNTVPVYSKSPLTGT